MFSIPSGRKTRKETTSLFAPMPAYKCIRYCNENRMRKSGYAKSFPLARRAKIMQCAHFSQLTPPNAVLLAVNGLENLTDAVVWVSAVIEWLAKNYRYFKSVFKNLHESPSSNGTITSVIAGIDLILETQDTVIVTKISWLVDVGVLNGEVDCLSAGILDACCLLLSATEVSLESTLLAIIALASSLGVPACASLILPSVCSRNPS